MLVYYGSPQTYLTTIRNCVIYGNYAAGGGGIFICDYCNVDISGCIIVDNYGTCGGGVCIGSLSEVTINRCLISDNIGSYGGGGINNIGATKVYNSIISGNTTPYNREGAAVRHFFDRLEFYNTIIVGNTGPDIVYVDYVVADISFNNCAFFDNSGPLFAGNIPPGLGIIEGFNIRGDSCDIFHNIYQDPMFLSFSGDSAYRLREDSPCIDAGYVPAGLDSDGTAPDIGLYYYHQTAAPPLSIIAAPVNPPISIPAAGGSLQFDITLNNSGAGNERVNIAAYALLPQGSYFGPLFSRGRIDLPAGAGISRRVNQYVPGRADSGDYAYIIYAESAPGGALFADYFEFSKDDIERLNSPGNWQASWIEAAGTADKTAVEMRPPVITAYPNPFNFSTALRYQLQNAGFVKLSIYDIAGREVASLVNGHQSSGYHEIAFDGTELASGVHFAMLEAMCVKQVRKLLLVK